MTYTPVQASFGRRAACYSWWIDQPNTLQGGSMYRGFAVVSCALSRPPEAEDRDCQARPDLKHRRGLAGSGADAWPNSYYAYGRAGSRRVSSPLVIGNCRRRRHGATAEFAWCSQRVLHVTGRRPACSPGAPAGGRSVRRHALAPRRRAPRCAKLRRSAPHPRLDTELAAPGASRRAMLRHGAVRLQACEPTQQQSGRAWLG